MEKVIYNFSGSLPTLWGDFYTEDINTPNVTISGGKEKDYIALDPEKGENGYWVDVDVVEEEINEETAKIALNKALKLFYCTNNDFDIEIVATGEIINV